jgi:HNH endonuclease
MIGGRGWDVVGYEGLYSVTSDGRVWSNYIKDWVEGFPNSRGYVQISLTKAGHRRKRLLAILVLTAYRGPRPDGLQGCHRDGDKLNNTLDNLYWGTPAENTADQLLVGNHPSQITRRKPHRKGYFL